MGEAHHKAHAPSRVRCAVITASSTRTAEDDAAGRLLQDLLAEAGHPVAFYRVVPDDVAAIQAAVREAAEAARVVLVTGGTGLAPTDVTVEAVTPLLDRRLPGFGELFRWLSYQEIGTAAILSRALAGVVEGRFVACLPGSPAGARLALEQVLLPELGHIVQQIGPVEDPS